MAWDDDDDRMWLSESEMVLDTEFPQEVIDVSASEATLFQCHSDAKRIASDLCVSVSQISQGVCPCNCLHPPFQLELFAVVVYCLVF